LCNSEKRYSHMWRSTLRNVSHKLKRTLSPVVEANSKLYEWFNIRSRLLLGKHGKSVPTYITANAVTTARTGLVFPTLLLYSNGFSVLPASLVVINVTFDYVDGAIARWEKSDPNRVKAQTANAKISPQALLSCQSSRLASNFGSYYDAIVDKAFAIPVWLVIFQNSFHSPFLQFALLGHASIEMYSSFVRTKAYYNEPSPLYPELNAKANQSAVVAGYVGKTKQFLAMLGTALVMVPFTSSLGTALLGISLPLAYLSVYQKNQSKSVYCEVSLNGSINAAQLEMIEQSKALGSSLVVGLRADPRVQTNLEESIDILKLNRSVDFILTPDCLPDIIDEAFLDKHSIDLVSLEQHTSETDKKDRVCVSRIDGSLFEKGRTVPVALKYPEN